jgi:two-component system, sporulation sensor kinase A
MIFLDYIMNLSIFSLLVSTPLIIRSFINHKPLKQLHIWAALYAGIVSSVLVSLSVELQGYSFDIRYAILILVFAYLGITGGLITGSFVLVTRLMASDNWLPAIVGWLIIMVSFTLIHNRYSYVKPVKRSTILTGAYIGIYVLTVPLLFNIFRNDPIFHLQYLVFIILGVMVGGLLIESYEKLYRIISDKKKIEKTLEESEAKYRLIAENTSDLIMVVDKGNRISYLSPSHEIALGYAVDELETKGLLAFIHPEDISRFQNLIKRNLADHKSYSIEFRMLHKNGHFIEFDSRSMPVLGEERTIEHMVVISRDISERKKAEEILLQSEKLSIVGELAAGVAHEIRNPLTTIKGFVQLYKKENSSIEFNDLLLSELDRIETITSEMLSLGKPQAIQLNTENLKVLLESTIDLLSPQATMKDIQFVKRYQDMDFYITCEKNQIRQVFLNIFKNAMEAMPQGGIIEVCMNRDQDNYCIVSIKDEGCGIPEELLPRLGEPFYTLKEKGTGLGLMICHKIIKQHNGSIFYQSRLNEGTRIKIHLPLITAGNVGEA